MRVRLGAYPRGENLTCKHYTRLGRLAGKKHSIFYGSFIIYEGKNCKRSSLLLIYFINHLGCRKIPNSFLYQIRYKYFAGYESSNFKGFQLAIITTIFHIPSAIRVLFVLYCLTVLCVCKHYDTHGSTKEY